MSETLHLHPTAPLAPRVLLPCDPGRALMLAQTLIEGPKMFNHHRGLWGYTGPALADGRPLTIQSTGMGGPSAAIVITELIRLGARTLLRIGTCGALNGSLALGDLVVVGEALAGDGTSRALGAGQRVAPAPRLLAALRAAGGQTIAEQVAVSTDVFYDERPDAYRQWQDAGAQVVEMESATLLTLSAQAGLEAGALLIVCDLLAGARRRIDAEVLTAAEQRIGELAMRALTTA